MDMQRDANGRRQFVLGPVELWIVCILGTLVVGGSVTVAMAYAERIDTLTKTAADSRAEVSTKLAVLMQQMDTMNKLIADVPDLRMRVGRMEVVVDNNRERIFNLERKDR